VKEETNLKVTQATQFRVYSDPERHPRQTITVAFLVKTTGKPEAGDDAEDIKWFDINTLPELASDHKIIISDALASR